MYCKLVIHTPPLLHAYLWLTAPDAANGRVTEHDGQMLAQH